jgi:hypothetical protein
MKTPNQEPSAPASEVPSDEYDDRACELLKDVEFKDEKAIAIAVVNVANELRRLSLAEKELEEAKKYMFHLYGCPTMTERALVCNCGLEDFLTRNQKGAEG